MILDKTDLTILSTLARNCRASYSSIDLDVRLTSKSTKARVKKMLNHRVIEKFVVRINPSLFGLMTAILLIKTSNGISKEEIIKRIKHFGEIAYHVYHMDRTCVATLIIKKPLDDTAIQSLNHHLFPATILGINILEGPSVSTILSKTDLRIVKCLLILGVRTAISDIAREVGISEKTTTRRLTRMKESNLIDFSIQCNPPVMTGYIQFAIPIITSRFNRRRVIERIYSESLENILYSPSVIDGEDRLLFVLFAENVFTVDSILSNVISFAGVESADVYILTKWQYHFGGIIKEIDNKILL